MEQLLFGNVATGSAASNLAGSELTWPIIRQGTKLKLGFRPVLLVGDESTEISRNITAMRAAIGILDESSLSGEFSISIDGTERAFTAAGATLTSAGHEYTNGMRAFVTSSDTLPDLLNEDCLLWFVDVSGDDYGLALTQGGAAIITGDAGLGVHSIHQITPAIAFDADGATFQAAINSHADVGAGQTYETATAELLDRSWIVKNGKELLAVPYTIRFNRLRPISFVRLRTNQAGGIWSHEFRMAQAPIAFSDERTEEIHNPPVVTEVTPGGNNGEQDIPERQKVIFDPLYRGSYNLSFGGRLTTLLDRDDGPAEWEAVLNEFIAVSETENFTVENPSSQVGHILFEGDLAGIDQDLIVVTPIDGPPGDSYVTLDLGTWEA
ncbi:MAG: hypothetical protein ACTSU8_02120, partial [Alphaproteobacteria bacterium]